MTSPTAQGTGQLVGELRAEILRRLDKKYELVYVDYRDELRPEQIGAIVRGDWESLDSSLEEFESDARWQSCKEIIEELSQDVIRDWERDIDADLDFVRAAFLDDADEYDSVRFEVEERDESDWIYELASHSGNVLLRIEAIDEDHSYSFEEVKPRRVLKDLGFRATRANIETVNYVLANASPEYSVLMGYWIVGANVGDLYKLLPAGEDAEIEIVNPYLYLGNPFSGSGFISEQPLEGTVRVRRGDMRTDEDQFGYSVNEIYGGLYASQFECEIRKVETEEQ